MSTLVIVGAQWGDEAKGKLVDVLGGQADYVVRFSGGNNAGHTVVVGTDEFRFHLVPAGILHPSVTAVLGSGMVVCPKGLLEELDEVRTKRSELGRLIISPSAHVVFPYHRILDRLEEEARQENKIGTTSRGIGPAYQDKAARLGIRMGEFVVPDLFHQRLKEVLTFKNRLLSLFDERPLDFDEIYHEYCGYAERLRPYVADTGVLLQDAVEAGKKVLFEGAQGAFLDVDEGTYPYVTSSHPTAAGACLGTGIGPRLINSVLGVCKAYTTRVGGGPFPTELLDETGERIREKGHEYGTTTGRGRRCGWLDLVMLRQSCRMNSLSGLVLTRLDVLSGLEELKVAVGYSSPRGPLHALPMSLADFQGLEPVYETLPGWQEELTAARSLGDLPKEARDYMAFIEDHLKTPIAILSIGPARDQTIMIRPDLIWG